MLRALVHRLRTGYRTEVYSGKQPQLSDRFRGLPVIKEGACGDCKACLDACPTVAVTMASSEPRRPQIDLGKCTFCGDCQSACPDDAIRFGAEARLAARARDDLIVRAGDWQPRAAMLDQKLRAMFGRSLQLRQVSAGGCNACEADINVLSTIGWDLGSYGIKIVASPRHADGLLITGPVTENMRTALAETYAAIPEPKIVIAVGACAISGGLFAGLPEVHDGVHSLPVDLYVPGCPPHPVTILDGLLAMLGRLKNRI